MWWIPRTNALTLCRLICGTKRFQSESELTKDGIITHLLTYKFRVHAVSTISSKHLSFISAIFCKKQSKHYYIHFFLPAVCHLFTLKSRLTARDFTRFPTFAIKKSMIFFSKCVISGKILEMF